MILNCFADACTGPLDSYSQHTRQQPVLTNENSCIYRFAATIRSNQQFRPTQINSGWREKFLSCPSEHMKKLKPRAQRVSSTAQCITKGTSRGHWTSLLATVQMFVTGWCCHCRLFIKHRIWVQATQIEF